MKTALCGYVTTDEENFEIMMRDYRRRGKVIEIKMDDEWLSPVFFEDEKDKYERIVEVFDKLKDMEEDYVLQYLYFVEAEVGEDGMILVDEEGDNYPINIVEEIYHGHYWEERVDLVRSKFEEKIEQMVRRR